MISNLTMIGFSTLVAASFFIAGGLVLNDNYIFFLGFIPTGYIVLCAIEYLIWNPNKPPVKRKCSSCSTETSLVDDLGNPECLKCYRTWQKSKETEN